MAPPCCRIALIQGHPDPNGGHFCHALASAYQSGAREAGHTVDIINIGAMNLPFLRCRDDLEHGLAPEAIRLAQITLLNCDHILMVHPLWNGGAPALVRAFMEHTFRPSFTFPDTKPGERLGMSAMFTQKKALAGKTARIVVTMQMPAWLYRWYFRPHQEAGALRLGGVRPVWQTPIGVVESADGRQRERWLQEMSRLGGLAR